MPDLTGSVIDSNRMTNIDDQQGEESQNLYQPPIIPKILIRFNLKKNLTPC